MATRAICPACGGELNDKGTCLTCGRQAVTEEEAQDDREALRKWLAGDEGGLEAWLSSPPKEKPKGVQATPAPPPHVAAGQPPPKRPPSPPARPASPEEKEHQDLRRWLEGDENALENWIGVATQPGPAALAGPLKDPELETIKGELNELRKTLKAELKNVKGGRFDPMKYLEEIARLNRELQVQVEERKKVEGDMDHLKKSSVAALKYVKTQQGTADGDALKKRLQQEIEGRRKVEIELKKAAALLNKAREEILSGLKKLPPDARAQKEKELLLSDKENQLRALEEQLKLREENLRIDGGGVGPVDADLQKRLQAELTAKEREFIDRENQLKKRIIGLEGDIQRLKIEDKLKAESQQLLAKAPTEVNRELEVKSREIQLKEKTLLMKEEEIKRLQDELKLREDEMKKLKEPLVYKEEELLRREEDLLHREQVIQEQLRKAQQAKREGGTVEEMELKQRIQSLKEELQKKEEEMRAKEKYLTQKAQELRAREQGLVQQELVDSEEVRKLEVQQERAKTGTSRLDDLLLGGIPFGSNVTIYGPPFIGKEVVVNTFIAEGLKKGVPALWVVTDKMASDIREELQFVLPSYVEYEKMGLVKYVDAYSKSMGADTGDPNSVYINDPTDHEAILKAVDEVSKQFKTKHPYYRLAFRSISTLIAYLDPTVTFKFLQPFAGRRKRDRAVSMYMIEKGMHGEQEIQMLGSVMDGMIDFKVEQLKTFVSIKGITDVQSRAWIQYMYSKRGVSIGSFSLDHIK